MEKAIFITKLSQLKYVNPVRNTGTGNRNSKISNGVNDGYDRLYYGIEFCERLIPSLPDLKEILVYLQKRKLDFSFVTPYVTNVGLERLKVLFDFLKAKKINCEIIINDWGMLNLINRQYLNFQPVLGRLLTKQKRGPSLVKLLKRQVRPKLIVSSENPGQRNIVFQKKLPLDLDPYYKGSNASSVPIIHNFLISQGIRRIELDNTAQGLFLELPKDKISASVYFPYIYISTTFFCPTAGCDEKEKSLPREIGLATISRSLLKIKSCKRQCQRYVFKLRHRTMPKVIYLKGNTQFYKNTKLPIRELKNWGVDRIVYQPEIPV